jgi:hypothetical protein
MLNLWWSGRSAGEVGGARPRRTLTTSSAISVPYTNTLRGMPAAGAGGGDAMWRGGRGDAVAGLPEGRAERGRRQVDEAGPGVM